jgi:hypothetical protein
VFDISAPQCPTHYSPAGTGDVLNIVVHKNIRLSDGNASDILDSDSLPVMFHILDHVKTMCLPEPVETFTDCRLIYYHIEPTLTGRLKAKEALDFTASTASAYRLSARTPIISDLNTDLPRSVSFLIIQVEAKKIMA